MTVDLVRRFKWTYLDLLIVGENDAGYACVTLEISGCTMSVPNVMRLTAAAYRV